MISDKLGYWETAEIDVEGCKVYAKVQAAPRSVPGNIPADCTVGVLEKELVAVIDVGDQRGYKVVLRVNLEHIYRAALVSKGKK